MRWVKSWFKSNSNSEQSDITSVGIVGLDYCGSTLINNVLSGLPNCIGAGETHWIVDKEKKPNQTGRCTECFNEECPVFSDEILTTMNERNFENSGKWWQVIGQSANKKIVISADKRPHHYNRFGIPDKLLFVIKDPRSHIVSWARRKYLPSNQTLKQYNEGNANFELSDAQFQEALKVWIRDTRKHISWSIQSKKPIAVLSLESFIDQGEELLQHISEWLETDFDSNALNYWESALHYIGSNHSVKRLNKERYFFKQIKKDKRWENVLTEEQSNFIVSHEKVQYQLNRLEPYILGSQQLIQN